MPEPLKVGDIAPDFSLKAAITKPEMERINIRLSDYAHKQNVVLAFHPFAFTAV